MRPAISPAGTAASKTHAYRFSAEDAGGGEIADRGRRLSGAWPFERMKHSQRACFAAMGPHRAFA